MLGALLGAHGKRSEKLRAAGVSGNILWVRNSRVIATLAKKLPQKHFSGNIEKSARSNGFRASGRGRSSHRKVSKGRRVADDPAIIRSLNTLSSFPLGCGLCCICLEPVFKVSTL